MMPFDRIHLGRQAREFGFVRDTFEKVCRLVDVLSFFERDPLLSDCLALKGGTAINLTIFDLPRLSVDIDLDYEKDATREIMMHDKGRIAGTIQKYMASSGYQLSAKSRKYHALDSFVFEYINTGGMKDNLKIEINYMLRMHIIPPSRRKMDIPWLSGPSSVLCVDPLEIFASKIVALMNRAAARDFYDIFNLQKHGLLDDDCLASVRRCVVFYSAIASEKAPAGFDFSRIMQIGRQKIRTDLLPVMRKGDSFNLETAQNEVLSFLEGFLLPETGNELEFWSLFNRHEYRPDLLFTDADILGRLKKHPMALWKCKNDWN